MEKNTSLELARKLIGAVRATGSESDLTKIPDSEFGAFVMSMQLLPTPETSRILASSDSAELAFSHGKLVFWVHLGRTDSDGASWTFKSSALASDAPVTTLQGSGFLGRYGDPEIQHAWSIPAAAFGGHLSLPGRVTQAATDEFDDSEQLARALVAQLGWTPEEALER